MSNVIQSPKTEIVVRIDGKLIGLVFPAGGAFDYSRNGQAFGPFDSADAARAELLTDYIQELHGKLRQ